MRLIIIAVLVGIFGPIATLILERHLTSAPEWIWRVAYVSCIFAGVSIAILSEPIYSRLKNPQTSPVFTTVIVSILAAIIFGGIWWFFIAQQRTESIVKEDIAVEPKSKSEQTIDIDYEVSSLMEKGGKYQRSVTITNYTINPAHNVHFSIKSEKQIINEPHPWPQGGGMIMVNYSKITGNTYEAEVGIIPPRRFIKIVLQADTEFEIEKVTIYD